MSELELTPEERKNGWDEESLANYIAQRNDASMNGVGSFFSLFSEKAVKAASLPSTQVRRHPFHR